MNASALLQSQGWLGSGHSLDAHTHGRGVKKPLLVSQKRNVYGVGKKRVDVAADQWWSRAFDEGLKGLDVGTSTAATKAGGKAGGNVVVDTTARQEVQKKNKVSDLSLLVAGGSKWMGLYDGFRKGEGLEGTIGRCTVEGVEMQDQPVSSKIVPVASDDVEQVGLLVDQKEGKKDKKDKKKRRDESKAEAVDFVDEQDSDRRARRREKKRRRMEEQQASETRDKAQAEAESEHELTTNEKKKKSKKARSKAETSITADQSDDQQRKKKKRRKHREIETPAG